MKFILTLLVIYVVYKYFIGPTSLIKGPVKSKHTKKDKSQDDEFIDYIEVDEEN